MSGARDRLKDALLGMPPYQTVGEQEAESLIDDHAHELAEAIREELYDAYGGFYDGVHVAASLIDPKEKS